MLAANTVRVTGYPFEAQRTSTRTQSLAMSRYFASSTPRHGARWRSTKCPLCVLLRTPGPRTGTKCISCAQARDYRTQMTGRNYVGPPSGHSASPTLKSVRVQATYRALVRLTSTSQRSPHTLTLPLLLHLLPLPKTLAHDGALFPKGATVVFWGEDPLSQRPYGGPVRTYSGQASPRPWSSSPPLLQQLMMEEVTSLSGPPSLPTPPPPLSRLQ